MSKSPKLSNRATIYSNGIADFQRVFEIDGKTGLVISLPVHEDHLADVLGSLTVLGNVKLESPPTFQPENQDETNIQLSVMDSFASLATQLTGSVVTIHSHTKKKTTGQLLGLDKQQIATEGRAIEQRLLVIKIGSKIERIAIDDIGALQFEDPIIQTEIDKALNRKLREIKPNSTFLDLELSTESTKAEAIVQYTIPAAAWKITYRILIGDKGALSLHGHAIVDNNTEEDWNDFQIAVVMGQPITFSTDLATSKIPSRKHVNVVQEAAIGSVEVETMVMAGAPMQSLDEMPRGAGGGSAESMMARKRAGRLPSPAAAKIDNAEVSETGDFCIFESITPVSIDAHRSAVIPVFQSVLENSKSVLHFDRSNHAERPFRAIQFKNTTDHSLGRGMCTVYDQQTYVGSCIFPATKPDDESLVPHALETGVRVRCHHEKTQSRRVGAKISKGVAQENELKTATTTYLINSSRDEAMNFVLDHPSVLRDSTIECILHRDEATPIALEQESLKSGTRIQFQLLTRDVVSVTVTETSIVKSRVVLVGDSFDSRTANIQWIYANLVESNSPVADNGTIRRAIEFQRLIDEKEDQINHGLSEVQRLTKRQERLRKNLKTGGGENQDEKWRIDLGRAEDAIVQLEDEHIPELESEKAKLMRELYDSLKTLTLEWTE